MKISFHEEVTAYYAPSCLPVRGHFAVSPPRAGLPCSAMRFIVFQAASLSDMFLRRASSAPPHGFPYIALLDVLRPILLFLRFIEVGTSSAACSRRRSGIRRGVGSSSSSRQFAGRFAPFPFRL